MVATLTLRVYTGSAADTESATAQTGIDFISADNDTNSQANRQANPISVGSRSYEKWLKLKVDTKPSNSVSNFLIWGDGAVTVSTGLYFTGAYTTGTTPTNATSTIADVSFTNYTAGNKATWDSGSYTNTSATTKYAVFQLRVDADCAPGNWNGTVTGAETINYSYDET
jgi:hypothetical protein